MVQEKAEPQKPGKPESQVPTEAEGTKFWEEMDGPHFADHILRTDAVVTIDNVDHKVTDFTSREGLIETWDQCEETITEWLGKEDVRKKPIIYWMAVGTLSGVIFGVLHGKLPAEADAAASPSEPGVDQKPT